MRDTSKNIYVHGLLGCAIREFWANKGVDVYTGMGSSSSESSSLTAIEFFLA